MFAENPAMVSLYEWMFRLAVYGSLKFKAKPFICCWWNQHDSILLLLVDRALLQITLLNLIHLSPPST